MALRGSVAVAVEAMIRSHGPERTPVIRRRRTDSVRSMAAPVTQVLCILVDHNFQRALGNAFCVEVPSDDYAYDLHVKVKKQCPNKLERVDACNLEVWKLRNPQEPKEIEQMEYLLHLRRLDDVLEKGEQGDDEAAWRVAAADKISLHLSELPKNRISVLVRVPVNVDGTANGIHHCREFSIRLISLLAPAYHV